MQICTICINKYNFIIFFFFDKINFCFDQLSKKIYNYIKKTDIYLLDNIDRIFKTKRKILHFRNFFKQNVIKIIISNKNFVKNFSFEYSSNLMTSRSYNHKFHDGKLKICEIKIFISDYKEKDLPLTSHTLIFNQPYQINEIVVLGSRVKPQIPISFSRIYHFLSFRSLIIFQAFFLRRPFSRPRQFFP